MSAPAGQASFYLVRAEDGQTGLSGPANGGLEDKNQVVYWAQVGDPAQSGQFMDDGGDSDAWFRTDYWSVSDLDNATPAGTFSYHSAPRGAVNATSNVCAALTTPPLALLPGALLTYQANFNLEEGWDGVVVELSTDGGMSWNDLPPLGGYPSSFFNTMTPPINACRYPAIQGAFSGPPGNPGLSGWTAYTADLAPYAGQTVQVRWVFSSDPGFNIEGFLLDEVLISPASPGGTAPPDLGNVLLGAKEAPGARYSWTDIPAATSYRLYHALARDMAGRDLAGADVTGTPGVLDLTPRLQPVHFYRVHGVADCVSEGP